MIVSLSTPQVQKARFDIPSSTHIIMPQKPTKAAAGGSPFWLRAALLAYLQNNVPAFLQEQIEDLLTVRDAAFWLYLLFLLVIGFSVIGYLLVSRYHAGLELRDSMALLETDALNLGVQWFRGM